MKLQPLRTNPFNWLECRPTGKINPLRLLSADRYDAYTSDFNCNCLDFRIANRSAEIYAHTTFARSSTWKIVCKISFLILLSATAGCAVVVFWGPGSTGPTPSSFHWIGTLGRFSLYVAMSVCLSVCLSVCMSPLVRYGLNVFLPQFTKVLGIFFGFLDSLRKSYGKEVVSD